MNKNKQVVKQLIFYDNYIPIEFNYNKNSNMDQKSYYEKEFPFIQDSCIKCSGSQTKTQPKKRNKNL